MFNEKKHLKDKFDNLSNSLKSLEEIHDNLNKDMSDINCLEEKYSKEMINSMNNFTSQIMSLWKSREFLLFDEIHKIFTDKSE